MAKGSGREGAWQGRNAYRLIPMVILLLAALFVHVSIAQGQPPLVSGEQEYHPDELVLIDLVQVAPNVSSGHAISLEVDSPFGHTILVGSINVSGPGGNLTLSFRLPRDCPQGTYTVMACFEDVEGNVTLVTDHFEVTAPPRITGGRPTVVPILGVASGVIMLILAATVATGDASKYYFFGLLWPLFTRLQPDDALSNKMRWQILGYIVDNPGQNYNRIKRELDLPNGSLAYHLKVLERLGKVRTIKDGRLLRFYTPEAAAEGVHRSPLSDIERRILETIADNPRISQKEIALILDVKVDNVGYHLRKMVRGGVIVAFTKGRETQYEMPNTREDPIRPR